MGKFKLIVPRNVTAARIAKGRASQAKGKGRLPQLPPTRPGRRPRGS